MTNLTHWQHADLEPTWSADGRSIYFMSFKDWPGQLYRMDADGGQVTRLTNGTAQEGFPVARPAAPASMPQATAR
jgi:TolB protein